ncbi:MAG: hypothetical protein JW745_04180 [Sedimentisphaerales bacterium]|nr:hypothetical protein [Sedimentisphaerales bacterium]
MNKANKKNSSVSEIVSDYRRVWFISDLVRSVITSSAALLFLALVLLLADNFFRLSATTRLLLTGFYLVVVLSLLIRYIILVFLNKRSLDAVAVEIERHCDITDNVLINSLQFERRQTQQGSLRLRQYEKVFAGKTIMQGFSALRDIDKGVFRNVKPTVMSFLFLLLIFSLCVVYSLHASRFLTNAFARYIQPMADIPPVGSVAIKLQPSGTIYVPEGGECVLKVHIIPHKSEFELKRYPEVIWCENTDHIDYFAAASGESGVNASSFGISPTEPDTYLYSFRNIRNDIVFRISAADSCTECNYIKVDKMPRMLRSELTITPPDYTGIKPEMIISPSAMQSVLPGTKLAFAFELDKPVSTVTGFYADNEIQFSGNNNKWQTQWQAEKAGTFSLAALYQPADINVPLLDLGFHFNEDRPPLLNFVSEQLNFAVEPGQRLNIPLEISDDFGLKDLTITVESARDSVPEIIKTVAYPGPPGTKNSREYMLLTVDASRFNPDESYIVRAFASDFSPAANIGQARSLVFTVRSLTEMVIDDDSLSYPAFAQLELAIKAQQAALGICDNITANLPEIITLDTEMSLTLLQKHRDSLKSAQQLVGDYLKAAWEQSPLPRPDFIVKADQLNKNENTRVMAKIVVLASQRRPDSQITSRSLDSIASLQRLILDKLLALKALAVMQEEKPSDTSVLPQEAGQDSSVFETLDDKLDKFQAELENFIASQQHYLEVRDSLGNIAVADLSFDQIDQLDALAIEQWRLTEALSRVINDFTNVDLQDYGDSTLIEKLSSIYQAATELDKAAHAAADDRMARIDAYRLETQAVEMAQEILINCQAILDYYDNIQFIAEVAEDQQLVVPLAELPDELVDLVGDLLTSELEMAQEIEDIGSYLNSLDHTAGPVADGTISSTSAKGVTGDQKPEDNVIQGRSGAGRSGMADGQMVESYAKALTDNDYSLPERPGNSPLEDGRVTDDDINAQTGGSGLGKLTDQAAPFGLDGVLPPRILQQMQAVLTDQQTIITNTQQLLPRLTKYNLSASELEIALQTMENLVGQTNRALKGEKTGIDLKRAYNSTLDSLKKSHFAVGDQVRTRYIQQVSGSAGRSAGSAPESIDYQGYEDMIQAYFRVLAEKELH